MDSATRLKAFTLIEVLVACTIVLLLAAILFPVFSQAKAAAKATTCLSQEHQIGLVLALYASDNDDGAPTAGEDGSENGSFELNGDPWLDDVQPYIGTHLIYRCPVDESPEWDALVSARQTSYGLNAFFAPNHPPTFGIPLSGVARPAECVLVAELADEVTEDHFAPMFWGDPSVCIDPEKQKAQWDNQSHLPRTIDLKRHNGGSNYLFIDLHVKKMRFDRLWQQTPGSDPSIDNFNPAK
jgi:prepilin-type processing-associated H-X9-DG protein/prepilin-type N-terminal cleavage/methylation domain-containing protein